MTAIKSNVHRYDTHGGDATDAFAKDTVYTLTLLKKDYTVTGSIDHGIAMFGQQSSTTATVTATYDYEDDVTLNFTPTEGYQITKVTVTENDHSTPDETYEGESLRLNNDGSYTYSCKVTSDITVNVITALQAGALTVTKTVSGLDSGAALPDGFAITVKDSSGDTKATLKTSDSDGGIGTDSERSI